MTILYEDPLLLESFTDFIRFSISNEEYSLSEVKKSQKTVNDIKRKYSNPLIPNFNKFQHESRSFLIMKTLNHHKTLIACSLSQKEYSKTYNYLAHILIKLTAHQYKQIRTKAISALESALKASFLNLRLIVKQI